MRTFWQKALWILWAVALVAHAGPAERLSTLLGDLQATQGHFSQVLMSQHARVLQSSSGSFALLRPGKFRWQTETPAPQLLIADGNKVWLYDHDLNQVSWSKEQVDNKQSPAMLLVGDITSLAKQYRITSSTVQGREAFVLTPRRSSFFEQVQVVFVDEILTEMRIQDNLGQSTQIQFSDLSDGAAASLFQFTPPKGADVVAAMT